MLSRLSRIKTEFGTKTFLKTLLLLIGLLGMSLLGVFAFETWWPTVVSVVGLLAGWLLRGKIVDHGESLTWAVPVGVTVYGVVLLVGERILGISGGLQLLIITLTTVTVFNIQFWWLSDPEVMNAERDDQ